MPAQRSLGKRRTIMRTGSRERVELPVDPRDQHLRPGHGDFPHLAIGQIGHLAFVAGVELHELSTQRFDLEDLFFSLTSGDQA